MTQKQRAPYINLSSIGTIADLLFKQVFFTLDAKEQAEKAKKKASKQKKKLSVSKASIEIKSVMEETVSKAVPEKSIEDRQKALDKASKTKESKKKTRKRKEREPVDALVCHVTGLSSIEDEMKEAAHAVCAVHLVRTNPILPYLNFEQIKPLMNAKDPVTYSQRYDLALQLLDADAQLKGFPLVNVLNPLRIEPIGEDDLEYGALELLKSGKLSTAKLPKTEKPAIEESEEAKRKAELKEKKHEAVLYCMKTHEKIASEKPEDRYSVFDLIHSPQNPFRNVLKLTKELKKLQELKN